MIRQLFNWRTALALVAVAIVTGTVFYSNFLAKKIAVEERKKVNVWVQSLKTRAATNEPSAIDLTNIITSENTDIPIIETDENDNPSGEGLNLDTFMIKSDSNYLKRKVSEFKKEHAPISVEINKDPLIYNNYYYGNSLLLKQVRYYPLIQLLIVALFIFITLFAVTTRNKSTQNQVWAGMAKETAHQLGTPISSLQGWIEMLKENKTRLDITDEMEKDIERLKLISDRFGKIGSTPKLEEKNIVVQVEDMVTYIKRRSTDRVSFQLTTEKPEVLAMVSGPLLDWVIENLLKNALDATEGVGAIKIKIKDEPGQVVIDIADTGKGISKKKYCQNFQARLYHQKTWLGFRTFPLQKNY